MTAQREDILLFASLKTYFGYAQTQRWIRKVSRIVGEARSSTTVRFEVAVFPEVAAMSGVAPLFAASGIVLGSQDVAPNASGPQTGEVSARVLAEIGATYVEIGHAERRLAFGETEDIVAHKLLNAVEHGLVPLVCVGEQQSAGAAAAEICVAQLESALSLLDGRKTRVVVAYEPVYAIGAKISAPLDHVVEVIAVIREYADSHPAVSSARLIYGGSAGPDTVPALRSTVDGLFLGRFVHDPHELRRVIDAYAAAALD